MSFLFKFFSFCGKKLFFLKISSKLFIVYKTFCLSLLIFSFLAEGQTIQTLTQEIQIETNSKSLAHKRAVSKVSRDLVIKLLGKEKYQAEKRYIEKNIINNQNRYILSVYSSQGKWNDQGKFVFNVSIKVSKDNLKKLLIEHHLFDYSSQGAFCVLPFVSFSNDKLSYSWWLDEGAQELKSLAQSFFDLLTYEFVKVGFYVHDPIFYQIPSAVPPSVLPKKSKSFKNFIPLLDFYSCDILLSGHIHKRSSSLGSFLSEEEKKTKSWLEFSIKVFQAKTRYQILDLRRKEPFHGSFLSSAQKVVDSLVYQLSHHHEEGSLGWSRFLLNIQGALSYSDRERLASLLVQNSESLEKLKVSYMNASQVLYSAESSKDIKQTVKDLKKLSVKGFNIQVRKTRDQAIEIYAQKLKR